MKLSLFYAAAILLEFSAAENSGLRNLKENKRPKSAKTKKSKSGTSKKFKQSKNALPEINSLMDRAFPKWEVDSDGNRLETKSCTVDLCEWNPYFVTKRYNGLHPDLGGHPTDIDVGYHFFGGSPFGGQPYAGTPHHCGKCDANDKKAKSCHKVETVDDSGPYGPGHVPPHISLASLTWYVLNIFLMLLDNVVE